MKQLFIFLFILITTGCGNDTKKNDTTEGISQSQGDEGNNTPGISEAQKTDAKTESTTPDDSKKKQAAGKEADGTQTPGAAPGTGVETPNVDSKSTSANRDGGSAPGNSLVETNGVPASDAADPDPQTIIYIGIFARWNSGSGEQYDGSYDTAHSLFVLCSTNHCEEVPRSQIVFQMYGSCDTAKADRIKLFKINKNGSINPNGSRIKVIGNKGIVQDGRDTRVIKFDPPTIKRIEKASIYQKQPFIQVKPDLKAQKVLNLNQVSPQKDNNAQSNGETEMLKQKKEITDKSMSQEKKTLVVPNQVVQPQASTSNATQITNATNPDVPVQKVVTRQNIEPQAVKQQPVIRKIIIDTVKTGIKMRQIQRVKQ